MARNESRPSPGLRPNAYIRAQREDEPAAQRGGGAGIRAPEKIVGTLDVLSEQFHGPVMRG